MANLLAKISNQNNSLSLWLLPLLLILGACGGEEATDSGDEDAGGNSRPLVAISSPGESQEFESGQLVRLSGSANDAQDGDLGGSIEWRSNLDGLLGTGEEVFVNLSNGQHAITATVADSKNSTASDSVSISIVEPQQNSMPEVTINSPSNGASYVESQQIVFTGSASDAEDGNLSNLIEWQSNIDGSLGTGGSVTAVLSIGNHTITANVTDQENGSASEAIQVIVSEAEANAPPEVVITSPESGSEVQESQQVQLNAQASDEEDGDISGQISWSSSIDGQLGNGAIINVQFSPGTHQIVASVSDSEGLQSQAAIELIVNAMPNLQITSPSDNAVVQQDSSVELIGEATDAEDGDLSNQITWSSSLDGGLGTGGTLSVSLSTGEHVITAQIEDSSGASSSANRTIRVNARTELSILSPTDESELDVFKSVILTASAQDPEDGDLSSAIAWNSNVDGDLGQGTDLSVQLSEGEHQLTATVTDNDGFSATQTINVTMSNATGTATVSWTQPTHNTDGSELQDLTGYKIYYGQDQNHLIDFVLVEDPSQTSFVVEGLFTDAIYYFSVVACNSLGIESDLSNIAAKDFVNQ